jgi:predicted DNA-binding transcriptional regulator YafY
MSKRESYMRYNLIISQLRKSPSTLIEINDYLIRESEIQGYDFNISKRTFQRDVDDIRSLFNVEIIFDFSQKVYCITNADQPDANERMLEAFNIFNAFNTAESLSKFVVFEKRRPHGTENLYGLLHAIKNKLQIRFVYHKFWEDEISTRVVEPYALKEFKNRWYILANDLKNNQVKSFALDRLSDLEITKKRFQLPIDFDANEHFRYCFGIISPNNDKPQDIILSFDPFQGKYIKTLPFHDTQQVILDNEDELRIKLKLCITHDFIMELLSQGQYVKVIEPKSLIEEIKMALQNAIKQYK